MPTPHLTVWYNTRCPVCDAGIVRQRNKLRALVRARVIEFRDINDEPDALIRYGATLDDIRRRLHATDDTGRLLVGADVALAVWRMTPGEAWLATARQSRYPPPHPLRLRPLRRCALCLEPSQGSVVSSGPCSLSSRNFAPAKYPGPTTRSRDAGSGLAGWRPWPG
jgi:predicted DCC family thiol-disulfide oxidoreductase YuxK